MTGIAPLKNTDLGEDRLGEIWKKSPEKIILTFKEKKKEKLEQS